MSLGIAIGVFSGYMGGGVDTVAMRIMDVMLAFPSLLLALVLVAILGSGLINAVLAITLVLLPHFRALPARPSWRKRNVNMQRRPSLPVQASCA